MQINDNPFEVSDQQDESSPPKEEENVPAQNPFKSEKSSPTNTPTINNPFKSSSQTDDDVENTAIENTAIENTAANDKQENQNNTTSQSNEEKINESKPEINLNEGVSMQTQNNTFGSNPFDQALAPEQNNANSSQPPVQGGGFPAPQGGGFAQQPAPQGGGFTAPQGGGFPPQGGGFAQQPAPQGGGFAQQPAPQGGGFPPAPAVGGTTTQKYNIVDLYWLINRKLVNQTSLDEGEVGFLSIGYNANFNNMRFSFHNIGNNGIQQTCMVVQEMPRLTVANLHSEGAAEILANKGNGNQIRTYERVIRLSSNWTPNATMWSWSNDKAMIYTSDYQGAVYCFTFLEFHLQILESVLSYLIDGNSWNATLLGNTNL